MSYESRSHHASCSAEMAAIDEVYRQARRCYSDAARILILDLKSMHRANELACKAVDEMINIALTEAGYHRIDRGPWHKVRGSKSVRTPKTEHLTPALEAHIAACRAHITALRTRYDPSAGHARSKTAARTYERYSKRAKVRLAAAEKAMQTIRDLAIREGNRTPNT